ncbi:glycoside hydrolase family 76 protein, partial [Aureobasidium melanogenum]
SGKTQGAIDVFMASKQPNGEIGGIGYWQTANGYTCIALRDAWSGSNRNATLLRDRLSTVESHHRHFINEFNDDTLWWGNCLLDAYLTNPDSYYLENARKIWQHVNRSMLSPGQARVRDMDMAGAVMWTTRPNEEQVNAITTGLFSELSARLALLEKPGRETAKMLEAAEKSFAWIERCRYRSHECIVLDTIKLRSQECVDWTFTYCTGQAIAAATAIFAAFSFGHQGSRSHKSPHEYLALACNMARKAICRDGWVEQDGTLTEHGAYGKGNHEPWKNDDAVGFKSVLLRSLAKLLKVLRDTNQEPDLQRRLTEFIKKQFDSLQQRNTNGNNQYGPWWNGPMEIPTSHSQMAALDVMAAIHLVQQ